MKISYSWSFFILVIALVSLYYYDRLEEDRKSKPQPQNIFQAIDFYNIPYIKKYIEDKKDINARDEYGCTLLIRAAKYPGLSQGECLNIMEMLTDAGAEINSQITSHGGIALSCAVISGGDKVVNYLLTHGANPNIADNDGNTPLTLIYNEKGVCKIIRLLVQHGGDINHKNKKGETPLSIAQKYNNPELIKCIQELIAESKKKSNPISN